jgi:alkylation response protein AidB-like acyl-CoA dehydrogenase
MLLRLDSEHLATAPFGEFFSDFFDEFSFLRIELRFGKIAGLGDHKANDTGRGWAFGRRGDLERMFRDAQAASVMAPSSDVLKDFIGKASLGLPFF